MHRPLKGRGQPPLTATPSGDPVLHKVLQYRLDTRLTAGQIAELEALLREEPHTYLLERNAETITLYELKDGMAWSRGRK